MHPNFTINGNRLHFKYKILVLGRSKKKSFALHLIQGIYMKVNAHEIHGRYYSLTVPVKLPESLSC